MKVKKPIILSLLDNVKDHQPNKIALSDQNQNIDFKALFEKSNKIANFLIQKGKFTDTPICFCLEQSIEKVIVMLSIWKAGGAYVSLDPLHPEMRLQYLLMDTRSPILITTKALSAKFHFYTGELILIDEHREAIEKMPDLILDEPVAYGLCYLAYTSGSTGVPKAVMVEHEGLENFIQALRTSVDAKPEDTALHLSSSSFDAIVVDLWTPLSLGLQVFIYPDNRIVGEPLLNYIRENNITFLPYLPVSILATLPADQAIGKLRKIYTGGEAPIGHVIDNWTKKVELFNIYGPTETSVAVSSFKFNDSYPLTTIGKPFPNVDFYILDQELKTANNNEAGELCIGGIQVARGYYNQPELSAEKFINFETPEGNKIRIYKTGDLVRKLEDGNFVFMGRADQQIKIRGHRIEPHEIESQILQSGLVENCVLIVKEIRDEKQMICFYKTSNAYPEDLRNYLFERLPSYMIPFKFIEIEELPLTANGKTDKNVLQKIPLGEEKRRSLVKPQNELQQQISQIWREILALDTVGIEDNFFQFGGNSFLAYKLISRLRLELQLPLQTADLFRNPTIYSLEQYITATEFADEIRTDLLNENDHSEISAQQKGLWFIHQLHGSLAYHVGGLYPLASHTKFAQLEKAIRRLLKKHAVLRTTVQEDDTAPFIAELSAQNWNLGSVQGTANLKELLNQPFNLTRDFMLRAYIVYENQQPRSLFLIVHHLVTDGWSMPLITDEINQLYHQILNRITDDHLPQIGYKHFTQWQSQQDHQQGIDFWKTYLQDVQTLQLSHGQQQKKPTKSGKQFQFEVDRELTKALIQLSSEQSTTLYTTLISAFALLLQYYSGQSDICIGSPSANRPHHFEKTIGFFANMLPIRLQIEGNPAFYKFLRQNRDMLAQVFQHQQVPLETIVTQSTSTRFEGRNPLFQHVFVLQDPAKEGDRNDPVSTAAAEWLFSGESKFDLQFEAIPIGQKLKFNIDYAENLFEADRIAEMSEAFQQILKSITTYPHQKIGTIRILPEPAAWQAHIHEPFEAGPGLIELFEKQAQKSPDKIALVLSGVGISYQDLNAQSSKVAELLIIAGIEPGDFVACYQDQTINRVITLLGILKAGAAYVPLDITYPIDRIKVILKDTKASIIIAAENLKNITHEVDTHVMPIEALLEKPVDHVRDYFQDRILPSSLAYVIHTSGTTGTPKGVLIAHQALSNFIAAYGELLLVGEEDNTLQFAPYNFDGSVIDLWIPLTRGATVHLYPNNKLLGQHLHEFLVVHSITAIPFISPSVLSTLPQCMELPKLRTIGTGGESCPTKLSAHWRNRLKLINVYGPTETTVAVNQFVFDDTHAGNTLGTPVKNMRFYVLDQYLRPVPEGVTGHLYLSGIQLSLGYLNQPELTAEKFIQNPYVTLENSIYSKLYITGDQVRWLSDGLLEFKGRVDHQIKMRGFRIELGEIESVLSQIDGVKHATVFINEHSEQVKTLSAFITGVVSVQLIRKKLQEKLPSYMVPQEIYQIEHLPMTANGKIDLNALRSIAEEHKNAEEAEEPVNEYERIIQGVWSEVLQRKIKSLDDDFFHLGGHSLLLTKLYNKLFKHFPDKITLSELYQNSTVRKLAFLIQERYERPEIHNYALGSDPLSHEIRKDATIEADRFKFDVSNTGNYTNPSAILLTGVTGFVGVNLLIDLLRTHQADIYLLIRARDEAHARERLLAAMESQMIVIGQRDMARIKVLAGDLGNQLFGLQTAVYDSLTQLIDAVYHAGSAVNFIQPYAYMKPANVDALHRLIEFTTTHRLKQLSLLSTVGVFSWEHYFTKPALLKENADTSSAFKYLSRDMGYVQSKWVMEQVAQEAIKQGVPIVIFRLGYVFCHSLTGATAKYQWWSALIKTCVELNCYPLLVEQKEELTMVDFVSKAITHIAKNPEAIGETFHLSPEPQDNIAVIEFFELMNQELNFKLKPVAYQDWMQMWENDEDSPLYPLLNLFKFKAYDNKSLIEIHQNTPDFDISNTKRFLAGSDIENTKVKRENVEAFCKYLGVL